MNEEELILTIIDQILETGKASFSGQELTLDNIDEHVLELDAFLVEYFKLNEAGQIDKRRDLLATTRAEVAQKLIGEMI